MEFYFEDPMDASEVFHLLADQLEALGYPQLIDIVDGVTPIAEALDNADKPTQAALLANFLKKMRVEMVEAAKMRPHDPAPPQAVKLIQDAMRKFSSKVTKASDGGYELLEGEVVE